MFWRGTCDGLCGLQMFICFGWNIKVVCSKLGPLSDTLQAGVWLFPPFRKWRDHVGKFLPSVQYSLCFGSCSSGLLPLRSHKGEVTLLKPFPGVPSHLDYTQILAETILVLKLSVTTYFHCVTTTEPIDIVENREKIEVVDWVEPIDIVEKNRKNRSCRSARTYRYCRKNRKNRSCRSARTYRHCRKHRKNRKCRLCTLWRVKLWLGIYKHS